MKKPKVQFLDDKLYYHTIGFYPKDITETTLMVSGLHRRCSDYVVERIKNRDLSPSEVQLVLDRTFKYWELFMTRLNKKDKTLYDLVKSYPSYKIVYEKAATEYKKVKNQKLGT